MTKHYGVICKNPAVVSVTGTRPCKTVFAFESAQDMSEGQMEFPCPPLTPLVCPICREGYQYSSDDVVYIGLLDQE
jgi:hypothetical protein